MTAFSEVSNAIGLAASSIDRTSIVTGSFADSIQKILAALGAYIVLVYFVWKSDAIAASLAGGSTSMGTADIAGAAAAGAAAGAAIATGGASLAAAGSSAPASIADFMKNIGGGGGSVSNASTTGAGASQVGTAPVPPASESPMFSTRRDGVPIPPSSASSSPRPARSESESSASSSPGTSTSSPSPASPSNGTGASAGIGGAGGGAPSANMDDVLKAVGQLGQGNKTSVLDRLASANQQISQERAATHVSINAHHSD